MTYPKLLPFLLLLTTVLTFAHDSATKVPGAKIPNIVVRNCSGCHGTYGNSQLPYIPRLAGLSAPYIQRKLSVFQAAPAPPVNEPFSRIVRRGDGRQNAALTPGATANMIGISHAISSQEIESAARWYAARTLPPGKAGSQKLLGEGKSIFTDGLASQNLRACQSCHGPDAQGKDLAPRIAGQNASYLTNQLALFRAGAQKNSPVMTEIAQHLETAQAKAIAAYLQSQ